MQPKVSVIISTYNRAAYLREALDSVVGQTYPDIEIVVVNDGSTDNTEDVIAPYMQRITYIRQENRGWAGAKNRGLASATGEFLCILDDDDRFQPTKVERQIEMFKAQPHLGVCATGIRLIDEKGEVTGNFMPPFLQPETQALQLLRRAIINQSSAMIHRRCYERLGGLKEMHSDDYEYWVRASLNFPIGVVRELLTDYRLHTHQLTRAHRAEIDRAAAAFTCDVIHNTPLTQLIPGLKSETEGYALLGLVLCERKLFAEAETMLLELLPHVVAHLCLGILKLHERDFEAAERHLNRANAPGSPFVATVKQALALVGQVKTLSKKPNVSNTDAEVVALRKALSACRAAAMNQLLALAKTPTNTSSAHNMSGRNSE